MELSHILEARQVELGYRLFMKGGWVEVWHKDRLVCKLSVRASTRVIRATAWQDSFLSHLKELIERR